MVRLRYFVFFIQPSEWRYYKNGLLKHCISLFIWLYPNRKDGEKGTRSASVSLSRPFSVPESSNMEILCPNLHSHFPFSFVMIWYNQTTDTARGSSILGIFLHSESFVFVHSFTFGDRFIAIHNSYIKSWNISVVRRQLSHISYSF